MIKSYVSGTIILFSAVIVETAILSNITALPVVPDLLLLSLLYISLKNGRTQGQVLGFVSGLFLDLMGGIPLGFNCIIRTAIGYAAGILGGSVNSGGVVMPAVFGAAGILLKSALAWALSMLFPAMLNPAGPLSAHFVLDLIAGAALAPVMFKFLSLFDALVCPGKGEGL